MKTILSVCTALLFNCIVGGMICMAVGVSPVVGAVGANIVALFLGGAMPEGVLRAGVLKEVWTGEMVKALRAGLDGGWLEGIPDASSLVDNDVIHLVDVGVDPDVLINNTTYPIPLQALDDADIAIQLDKFQTKVTPITDDELYAISYDKMARVKESHSNSIIDARLAKAAHALCAKSNAKGTPVLTTTGKADATGRLRMTPDDVAAMKKSMDELGVPADNRRLVLCTDHVNDLLIADQVFKEQYNNINRNDGTVGRLYGFNIYEFTNTPIYSSAGTKKDIGAEVDDGDFHCSFAFYTKRVFKATGSLKMYYSRAENDPEYQRNKINFRHYFICMPKKADAGVVMMSGKNA